MPVLDRSDYYIIDRDSNYLRSRNEIIGIILKSSGVKRMVPIFKDLGSQTIELGVLIDKNTLGRILDGAVVEVALDGGSLQAGAGVLAVDDSGNYTYTPSLTEISGDKIKVVVDHVDAVQPLIVVSALIGQHAWENILAVFENNGQSTPKTISDFTTPKILEITATVP